MIPLSDENPTLRTPWMTWLLIGTTVAVWMTVQGAGSAESLATSVCNLGLVPGELTHRAALGTGVPLGDAYACVVDQERSPSGSASASSIAEIARSGRPVSAYASPSVLR